MQDWIRRRPGVAMLVMFVVLTGLGDLGVWWATGRMPAVTAEQGKVVDHSIFTLSYMIVPVFVLIVLIVVFAMTVWRVADDDMQPSEHQERTHRGVTLGWFGATSALAVLAIIYPGTTGILDLKAMAKQTPKTLVVNVTAQQWEWSFAYPQYGVAYSDTLVLPVDRRVKFVLKSKDVIHSFWIPSMRVKKDIIPGETRTLYLTPDKITSTKVNPMSRLQCAELCGIGHSQMWAKVRVVRDGQFTTWERAQAKKPPPMEM